MAGISKYEELEQKFADFSGYSHGVACNSGTSSLTLALAAIGVGPGDEVIIPDFTMVACAWAVSYLGATPVFADSGEDLNMSPAEMHKKITPKTKAIMPVHIYGRPCDMVNIRKVADAYGIYVIEDRSEFHGVAFTDELKGHISCYSLYRNKIVSAQEGGVLVTDDLKIKKAAADLKNMAFGPDHNYFHARMGFNMRMPEAQAELALKSLAEVDKNIKKRAKWAKKLDKEFAGLYEEGMMYKLPDRHVVWVYDFLCRFKDELIKYVQLNGGQIRHFFKPMTMQPMYSEEGYAESKAFGFSQSGAYIPYNEDKTIKLIKEFYVKKREAIDKAEASSGGDGADRDSDKESA